VSRTLDSPSFNPSLPLAFRIVKLFRMNIESIFEPGKE
jgi:DNA-binding XRE family transcriptional regulator